MPDPRPLSASLQQTQVTPRVLLPPAPSLWPNRLFTFATIAVLIALLAVTTTAPTTLQVVAFLIHIPLAFALIRWSGFFRPTLYSCCLDPRFTLLPLAFATVPGSWVVVATFVTTYTSSQNNRHAERLNLSARDALSVAAGLYVYQVLPSTWLSLFLPTALVIAVHLTTGKLADTVAISTHPKDRALERLARHYATALAVGGLVALIPLHIDNNTLLWMVPAVPLLVSTFRNQKHWNFYIHRESLTTHLQQVVKGKSELGVPPAAALIYEAARYAFGPGSVTRLILQNPDRRWTYTTSALVPREEPNPPSLTKHPRFPKLPGPQSTSVSGDTRSYMTILGPHESPFGLLEVTWVSRWTRSEEVIRMLGAVVSGYAAAWGRAALQHEHVTRVEHINDLLQERLASIIASATDIQTELAASTEPDLIPAALEALDNLLQGVNTQTLSDENDGPETPDTFDPPIPLGAL